MGTKTFFLLFLCICVHLTDHVSSGENILVYSVISSYSHRLSMWPLLEGLTEAGHKLTIISPFENKNPDARIAEYIPKLWQETLGNWGDDTDFYSWRINQRQWWLWVDMPGWGTLACEKLYEDDEFVEWVRKSTFDLVIVDTDFNECAFGLVHYWNAKLIMYSTSNMMGWYQDQYGLPDETSSITDTIFDFPPGKDMSFKQRFINAITPLVWMAVKDWYYYPKLESISNKGLQKVTGNGKSIQVPSFSEFERINTSLVFVTAHYSMSYQRSFPPNIVEVGGIGLPEKIDPLPKNIEDFIGKDHFVYICLGSLVEFTNLPKHTQENFLNAVKEFPDIKFIWKERKGIKTPLPKNIQLVEWAPQVSLLAHPKIRGFVTHCGLGGTTEAILNGVPLIMFPFFADQDMNAGMIESRGAGIKMEITDFSKDEFENAIREILNNPKYRNSMKRLSVLIKDRPKTPKETGVWWTEFVLRHENINEFLRPASVQQSWWVKRQIDVWLVALLIVLMILFMPVFIVYKIVKNIFLFQQSTNRSSRKKND